MPPRAAIAAGIAVGGTWLLERFAERPTDDITPEEETGTTPALNAAARRMPCDLERFPGVTHNGNEIKKRPGGAGADFIREYHIQRLSLVRTQGGLGGPAEIVTTLLDTRRPALSALCAKQWLEVWLDAWQVAAERSPTAFGISEGAQKLGEDPYGSGECDQSPTWREPYSLPGSGGLGFCRYTKLGKSWLRMRELHVAASAATAPAIPESVQTERPWILARATSAAIQDFALELDRKSLKYGDAKAEAFAQLKRDLAPAKFIRKAADVALAPVEVAAKDVIGPAAASIAGSLVYAVLPYVVVGGAVYLVVRQRRAA